jgi:ABC-type multidrug transport system fused ATPase/permease subunit
VNNPDSPTSQGVIFISCIIGSQIISNFIQVHVGMLQNKMAINACHSLISMVYQKILRLSTATNKKFKRGDIINFCAVDSRFLIIIAEQLPQVARLPFQMVAGVIMLYLYFGIGLTASLVIILILLFLNFFMAKLTMKYAKRTMMAKDVRMNKTTEALDNILHIKFNSWIQRFIDYVGETRDVEEKWINVR